MPETDTLRRCEDCRDRYPESQMEWIDISRDDEYYPDFIYVCQGCFTDGGANV